MGQWKTEVDWMVPEEIWIMFAGNEAEKADLIRTLGATAAADRTVWFSASASQEYQSEWVDSLGFRFGN